MVDPNNTTILIVEDEVPLIQSYKEILESVGYKTVLAEDGYKGLDALAAIKDEVKLVILDLMMPGIDGLEVLRQIRSDKDKFGTPKIVVLTNMTSDTVIKEAFKIGGNSYLIKTEMEYEDLISEVGKVLEN